MHRRFLALLMLCALLIGGAALAEEENLVQNGGFDEAVDGWPLSWREDMWLYDVGVSYLELRESDRDGSWCAMIENVGRNDARFIQDVTVEPGEVYRFSGWVKAEGCDPEMAGAGISLMNTFISYPDVHDTAGEWVYLESYVLTAKEQTVLTVGARLGDYSSDNVGKAFFDDISLVRVDKAPAGAVVIPLTNYSNWSGQQTTEAEAEAKESAHILSAMVALVVLLLLLWLGRKRGIAPGGLAIVGLLALAAALRLYLMATQPGFETDLGTFYSWAMRMVDVGPNAFYAPDYFCDYPPGYMYLLWFTGWLFKLFGVNGLTMGGRVLIKIVPLVADLGAIFLIWRLARRRLGEGPALLLAALYAFSPAILMDGAIWGQVDSVVSLGLIVTVALALSGNWRAALPVFTLTVLMKPQALIAGPIGVTALIMDMFPWKERGKKTAIDAGIGLLLSLGVAVIMLLPYLWGQPEPISWVINHYASTLDSYQYATLNTTNLYYLLGANWEPLSTMLGPWNYGTWGMVLMIAGIVLTVVLYIRRRDREMLPFFCALIYITIFLFGPKMHERYLFPAFALLILAYIRKPDWRILALFIGFTVTFYCNCALVLRDIYLPRGHGLAATVLSAMNLAIYPLSIWVAVDRRARPLPPVNPQLGEAIRAQRLTGLGGTTRSASRMRRKDWIGMLGLTLVYAAVAFIGLGSTVAPQTVWTSTGGKEMAVFDLGEERTFEIMYYAGVNWRDHTMTVEYANEQGKWDQPTVANVKAGDCFRWQYVKQSYPDATGAPVTWDAAPLAKESRYVRITADGPGLTLMEVAFRDMDGNVIPVVGVTGAGSRTESANDPATLADEPETIPDNPSYLNGTYFDEIYHARTGYEHANGLQTYETTHPPLGKVFIMIGIQLFGMTPFGWRFMGTLAGVLMVPAMYLLGKLLFRKTRWAFLAAFLMALDMMHLTQTRIATIDSYAVLFILLMYLCMFRYMQMSFFRDGWRTLVPLGLSGLFMGLGCASKWICIYAGAGLAVLFFWTMVKRLLEWRAAMEAGGEHAERVAGFGRYMVGTLGACLVFFVAIPAAIYYYSYIPYFVAEGGLTFERFWRAQVGMFNYHAGLVDDHAFQSPWYEWPLMLKPMYYYNGTEFAGEGKVATIMAMGNPAIWWLGLGTFIYMFWRWLRPQLHGEVVHDHRPAMLLLAFAAQFLPWVLVPRSTFIYHYFGSLPFVMLSIVYAFEQLDKRRPERARKLQIGYMALVGVLFVAFYPVATGIPFPRAWADAVNWLGFLKLPDWVHRGWIYY